jgi:hypothetical protein
MENKSKRHHYIPRFYIKNFCNTKGSIYINDKDDSSNYNNISVKYPKKIFFEWNRNTFEVNGEKSTVIENIYGDIEDKIAPHLESLVNSNGSGGYTQVIDVVILRNLIYLGYLTKWRLPINDDYVNQINSEVTFDDLNIFARIETDIFSLNNAWPETIASELKRLLFPTLLFNRKEDYSKVFKNTFIISFPEPLFITDNPFVELTIDKEKEFPSFIFPLSSNLLLVYCDFIDKKEFVDILSKSDSYDKYLKYLYNCVQITLMWHGLKYIGCEDKDYLEYYLSVVSELSDKISEKGGNAPFIAFTALSNFKDFA